MRKHIWQCPVCHTKDESDSGTGEVKCRICDWTGSYSEVSFIDGEVENDPRVIVERHSKPICFHEYPRRQLTVYAYTKFGDPGKVFLIRHCPVCSTCINPEAPRAEGPCYCSYPHRQIAVYCYDSAGHVIDAFLTRFCPHCGRECDWGSPMNVIGNDMRPDHRNNLSMSKGRRYNRWNFPKE